MRGLISITCSPTSWMLKKWSSSSSATIFRAVSIRPSSSSVSEVHREAGAHRLARLRVTERDAPADGDAVDRALAAGRQLHHEQLGTALGRQQLDELLQPHGARDAGPVRQQLLAPVGRRRQHPEPAGAGREDGLQADVHVRIAELARGRRDRVRAGHAPPRGASHADPVEQRVRLGLVVRAADRLGRGDQHGDALEALLRRGEPRQVERRLRQYGVHALPTADVEHCVCEAGVRAGRDEVERVAEMPADRPLGHVGTDQADRPLPVLTEPAQERRRAGRARRRYEDRRRAHDRSIRSSASWASRRSRSAFSIARIVSPIVAPG